MIYVMRHGQSQANADRIIAGHRDSPLSTLGRAQAEQAGRTIAKNTPVARIFTSPMLRARQTAEIIAQQLGFDQQAIQVIAELEERHLGELEGKSYDETPYGSGNVEDAEGAPGIEPIEHFYSRVQRVLGAVTANPTEGNTLIICHNGTGRMLQVVARGGQPIDMYKQPRLEHGVMYPLEIN